MEETAPLAGQGANESEQFAALAGLNDGFLGTGYSTSVELSFVAMALIVVYVALSTARYFLSGTRIMESVAQALGLRDR